MKVVKVLWVDSCNSNMNWTIAEDIEIEPMYIDSFGIVVKDTDEFLAIAQNYGDKPEQYSNITTIPKGCIKEVFVIHEDNVCEKEQKPADKVEPKFKVGDYIERKDGLGCHAKIFHVGGNVYGCEKLIYPEDSSPFFDLMFKNQDEFKISPDFQKKPAKEVEPKFHEGDWVVLSTSEGEKVVQIDSIEYFKSGEPRYITSEGRWFGNGTKAHLWTIKDAKDGDVLNSVRVKATIIFKNFNPDGKHINAYCALQQGFLIKQELPWDRDFDPATKERRELLFQKMKEAGYEWNSELKELKKIEQKPATWSEVDKDFMYDTLSNLTELKDRYGEGYGNVGKCIDWLKSLKPQNHWKPTEAQLASLTIACDRNDRIGFDLTQLLQELKKL